MNEANIKLLKGLEDYLKSQNKSPITINGYRSDLMIFFRFVEENYNDTFFVDLKKCAYVDFSSWLRERGCHGKRVQRCKASLQSLGDYVFCMLDDMYPAYHQLHSVIKVTDTQNVKPPVIYKDYEIYDLINILKDRKYDRCLWFTGLGIHSGLRKMELVRVELDWFKKENIASETNNNYYRLRILYIPKVLLTESSLFI